MQDDPNKQTDEVEINTLNINKLNIIPYSLNIDQFDSKYNTRITPIIDSLKDERDDICISIEELTCIIQNKLILSQFQNISLKVPTCP